MTYNSERTLPSISLSSVSLSSTCVADQRGRVERLGLVLHSHGGFEAGLRTLLHVSCVQISRALF